MPTTLHRYRSVCASLLGLLLIQSNAFGAIHIYSEGFNGLNGGSNYVDADSNLGPEWTFYSTNQGRSRIYDWGSSRGGVLVLDDRYGDNTYSLNEAILSVDLSAYENTSLFFQHYDSDDENHYIGSSPFTNHKNADGVSISSDGFNWFPIVNFTQQNRTWRNFSIDLEAAANAFNSSLLSLDGQVQFKFQQYDNWPHGYDARKFDNIKIKGDIKPPSSVVPEPQTAAMFFIGLLGFGAFAVKRNPNWISHFLNRQTI